MQMDCPSAFAHSLGLRLFSQQLAQHQNVDAVAAPLKLPASIVERMDRDVHTMPGTGVFVCGRLGSDRTAAVARVDMDIRTRTRCFAMANCLISDRAGGECDAL